MRRFILCIPGFLAAFLFSGILFAESEYLPVYADPDEPLETGRLLFLRLAERCDVFIDDAFQGRTPLLLSELEPGARFLVVSSESLVHRRKLLVSTETGGITYYTPAMHPPTGGFSAESDPPGAEVFLNGMPAGRTPLRIDDLEAGEYHVSLRFEDYLPVNRIVEVPRSEVFSLKARIEAGVALRFEPAPPADARIQAFDADGVLVAESWAQEDMRIPSGYNLLVIQGRSFRELRLEVEAAGQDMRVPFQPMMYAPRLVFSGLLPASRVFLDGADVTEKIEASALPVAPGSYELTVATADYLSLTEYLTLEGDEEFAVELIPVRDPAVVGRKRKITALSTILPGLLISAGSLVMNLDVVAARMTGSYENYVAMKYATLGTAGAGVVLVSFGSVVALLK